MDPTFDAARAAHLRDLARDDEVAGIALDFMRETGKHQYTYNFTWLGVPVIQFPQDLLVMQELVWRVRPNLIIETGVARGGGLVFYASLLELLDDDGIVVGIDVDIRPHARQAIDTHPLRHRIRTIEGSSTDPEVVRQVAHLGTERPRVLVALDSNHTHDHVLAELRAYSPLVPQGSYVVVFDTTIEDQPEGFFAGKPWSKTNNPKTAVREFLRDNPRFVLDRDPEVKALITSVREGFLRCVGP